eukprot:TRINITY_DN1187_c0_g1_i1.p1 TRINITY_DN1187_c0_g1~~TRINITY_DN1187_c0_g1_i1.p1  ORF type:complete len:314 (+),score=83.29 TRINITY_DN1187_c0_g1_i1:38-979(+)
MSVLKLQFARNNIRRVRFEEIPTFEEFSTYLQDRYNEYYQPEHSVITYIDEYHDQIKVTTQDEWAEMFRATFGNIKLYINTQQQFPGFMGNRNRRILLNRMPPFSRMRLAGRPYNFSKRKLRCAVPKMTVFAQKLLERKESLNRFLEISPNDNIALYNMACLESLLGNIEVAVGFLCRSVAAGYKGVDHMIKDSDLDNIKHTEKFAEIVNNLGRDWNYEQNTQDHFPQTITLQYAPKTEDEEPVIEDDTTTIEDNTPTFEDVDPVEEHNQWEQKLKVLNEMGFHDNEFLVQLLDQFGGDLSSTISEALQLSTR